MKTGIIILILIVIMGVEGCRITSNLNSIDIISENNEDVFILSTLIQDQLRNTNERKLDLSVLVERDSLKRIINNFEELKSIGRGGYIAVQFKFSNSRKKIELNPKEKARIYKVRWILKDLKEPYDGEIQLNYGERFYGIRKIIINRERDITNTRSVN